jgi:hypothetical protein
VIFNWAEADRLISGVLTFEDFVNASTRHVERSIRDHSELDNVVVKTFRERAVSFEEWQAVHHNILGRLAACSTRREQFVTLRRETVKLIEVTTRAGCLSLDEYNEEERRQLAELWAPNIPYEEYLVLCLKTRIFAQMSCRCLRTLASWYGDNKKNDWFDMYCDAFKAFTDAQNSTFLCSGGILSDVAADAERLLSAQIEDRREKILQGYNWHYDRDAADREQREETGVSQLRAQQTAGLRI